MENTFRLHANFVRTLEVKFPQLSEKSQDVVEAGTMLPEVDYQKTRGYIESLAKQINASYECNLFDGCAVLMRRLVEILLILSYRHLKIEAIIQDNNGNFQMLERMIGDAKANSALGLSRNGKKVSIRFGNWAISATRSSTPAVANTSALTSKSIGPLVELLHKSGIRT